MNGILRHKRGRWSQTTIVLLLIGLLLASPLASGRGSGHRHANAMPEGLTPDEWPAAPALTGEWPFGHEQTHKLVANTPTDGDHFGYSVAASGDHILVGADRRDSNTGVVFLYERNKYGAESWGLQQIRTADDGGDGDHFGCSVAISGDTLVVGAYGVGGDTGAAYIFERNKLWTEGWNQIAELTATGGAAGDKFGHSVGISGDTVVVGAYGDDSATGAAYIFARNHGGSADGWGQVKKLTASDPESGDWFGYSVALSGDTAVVGARWEDGDGGVRRGAAYIFERNYGGVDDSWPQVRKLTPSNPDDMAHFGQSVSISVDTVIVGAESESGVGNSRPGAAYIFERNQGGREHWGQVTRLTASDGEDDDYFGHSVSIDGESVVVGAHGEDGDIGSLRGAAYVFERNQGGADSWGQVNKLTAGDAQNSDRFGISVAISGHNVVAGAYTEDGGSIDPNADRGAAYLFVNDDGLWQEIAISHASQPEDYAFFGHSVAVSGDTVIIGAFKENAGGTDRGAAYIFTRNQGGGDRWAQVAWLTASMAQDEDRFGNSVSISGDTAVVGAYWDGGSGSTPGAAWVFERNQGPDADSWGWVTELTASGASDDAEFGTSVGISVDTIVVGAKEEDGLGIADGSAYVFERNQGGTANIWGQVTKLSAEDAANYDDFGYSVAISGDTIVVGAPREESAGGSNRGAAYVFVRNQGGADGWGQIAKLTASDGEDQDKFGNSVAISGDTIVVGAADADGDGNTCGAAYVFERNQPPNLVSDDWGQVARLTATDAEDGANFGESVSISGDTIVVGAYHDSGGGSDRGAAYIFTRNQGGTDMWGQVSKLTASDGADTDLFGESVGISGDTIVAGAYSVGTGQGAAYIYRWQLARIYLPLVTRGS